MADWNAVIEELRGVVKEPWASRKGLVVPTEGSVTFGHDAVTINAAVLYADMADSTNLVRKYRPEFAATCYKVFLTACVRSIRDFGGVVTAYDGDRVMAVYIGDDKCTRAVRTALCIGWLMAEIINPALRVRYNDLATFTLGHRCGIDVSDLFVVKTGIRNYADLAWIGNAANVAAKLSNLRDPHYTTYITTPVFAAADYDASYWSDGKSRWEPRDWDGEKIWKSSWWAGPNYSSGRR